MEDIIDLREKYLNHDSHPVSSSASTIEANAQELIDEEIERTEKMLKAIEKLNRLDTRLKQVLNEEKAVKARSLQQQRKTFAELVSIQGNSTDTKRNIERYLSLLPARATSVTPRGNSAGPLKADPELPESVSELDPIFFQTQVPRSETSSTIGDSESVGFGGFQAEGFGDGVSQVGSENVSETSKKSGGIVRNGDFVKRNVELAKNAKADNYGVLMTEEEEKRLEALLEGSDDDSDSEEDISNQLPNNRLPSITSPSKTRSTQSLAIEKFLPEVERLRLAEVDDKLSLYQSTRSTSSQLDFNDTASVFSSNYTSELHRIEDNQSKINFINSRLKQLRSGSIHSDTTESPSILPSAQIDALVTEIQLEQANVIGLQQSQNSDQELSDDESSVISVNRRALPPVELSREKLDELLENARQELDLDDTVENTEALETIEENPRPPDSRGSQRPGSGASSVSSRRSVSRRPISQRRRSRQSTPNQSFQNV